MRYLGSNPPTLPKVPNYQPKKKKVSIGNIYIIYKLKDSDEEKKNETIERKMKEVK